MTRDHEGYIYYKDKQVEHYSSHYVYTLQAARDLTELRNRCAFLERNGAEVSSGTAVWGWERYAADYGSIKHAELDAMLAGGGITFSKVVIDNNWNDEITFFAPGVPDRESVKAGAEFGDFYKNNDRDHGFEVSIQSCHYGGSIECASAEVLDLLPSCFEYLQKNGLLEMLKAQNFMTLPEREGEAENEPDDAAEWGDEE
jgi:hypothetical protein